MKTRIFVLSFLFFFAVPGFSQEVTLRVTDDRKLCLVSPTGEEKVLLNHLPEIEDEMLDEFLPVLRGKVVFYAKPGPSEGNPVWGAVDIDGKSLPLIDKEEYTVARDFESDTPVYLPEVICNTLFIPKDAEGNIGVQWVVTDFTGKVVVPGCMSMLTHEGEMVALDGSDYSKDIIVVYFYNADTCKIVNTLHGFCFVSQFSEGKFHEGLLLLQKGEKVGFVDKYGKTVIPFIYDDYYGFDFEKECFILCRGDVWYYVDKTGKEKVADF